MIDYEQRPYIPTPPPLAPGETRHFVDAIWAGVPTRDRGPVNDYLVGALPDPLVTHQRVIDAKVHAKTPPIKTTSVKDLLDGVLDTLTEVELLPQSEVASVGAELEKGWGTSPDQDRPEPTPPADRTDEQKATVKSNLRELRGRKKENEKGKKAADKAIGAAATTLGIDEHHRAILLVQNLVVAALGPQRTDWTLPDIKSTDSSQGNTLQSGVVVSFAPGETDGKSALAS